MILVFGDDTGRFDRAIAQWVAERAELGLRPFRDGEYHAIAVLNGENIAAAVIYHDHARIGTGGKIELSIAADDPRWARRGIIRALLHYPFVQLDCHVVVTTIKRANKRARKLCAGLGFKERGYIPNRPYDDDVMIYAMRREDAARWLGPEVAQKRAA